MAALEGVGLGPADAIPFGPYPNNQLAHFECGGDDGTCLFTPHARVWLQRDTMISSRT